MRNLFKELTLNELSTKREELRKEYRDVRFNLVIGHVDNQLKKRILRRQVARINTIIHEYEIGKRKE